jgi:hypothetical protein
MKLRFSSTSQQFEEDFTTSVYPFLEPLCDAIRVLRAGFIDEKIRLLIGSPECDLCLQAATESSQAIFKINLWPDYRRSALVPEPSIFKFEGRREEIALPFIRALRNLRASIGDADFEREYGAQFPSAAYAKLMQQEQ